MRRSLELAARARGRTSPNPMVGAVIARGDRILGEAFHRRAGAPHAEIGALRNAGRNARGATLYINLEPCCHFGRTPPCVDAILAAGVSRVVAAHRDPFPAVNGRGFAALRRAGVRVEIGLLRGEAAELNESYLVWARHRRPFVLVKAAISLDGRIATREGDSRWISSPASRRRAHRWRAASGAVLVGATTVRRDDPALTARPPGRAVRHPARVVLDGRLTTPVRARLLRSRGGEAIIFTLAAAGAARRRALERAGAQVVVVPGREGRVELRAVLADLARRGITRVMIEGGGETIASALQARLVDRLALFIAPRLIGGSDAVPLVAGRGAASIPGAIALDGMTVEWIGPDLLVQGRPVYPGRGR